MQPQTPSTVTFHVTVHFKPKGVPAAEASDTRTVEFVLHTNAHRDRVYERACEEAIEQGVISEYAMDNHWEPYNHGVELVSPPQIGTVGHPDPCR